MMPSISQMAGLGRSALQCGHCPLQPSAVKNNQPLPGGVENMGINLPLIWAVIILFGIMMYVIMDGFDLGIGILYPFVADDEDRDVMMNSVAPVWDGNETW